MNRQNNHGEKFGVLFVLFFATMSYFLAQTHALQQLAISPLIVGIVLGMLLASSLCHFIPCSWRSGIQFCAKTVLRIAIVLYGFRITFQDIYQIGFQGLFMATIMLSSTMILGVFFGMKLLKIDRDTSILVSAGSAVCGAAAVLATEEVLKSEPHKSAIAIGTVVLFGSLSMFLYPLMFSSGLLDLNSVQYGLYVGSSVHEVAQVVAAGSAVDSNARDIAVIVKMSRVMLIAPLLLILGLSLSCSNSNKNNTKDVIVMIPWFALLFIITVGFNSLHWINDTVVNGINHVDTFLLTMAMTALGMETHLSKFKQSGIRPMILALVLFLWLMGCGYLMTYWLTS